MIRYTLKCPDSHVFESWFKSAEAFDAVQRAGHLTCPECGASKIEKALMAPRLGHGGTPPAPRREHPMAALKRHVETHSDYVGAGFAAEARAIHEGTAPERSIYGEARADDARKLLEDGIPVAPLPFVPARKAN